MGYALANLHLTRIDFLALTPAELDAICEADNQRREMEQQERWTRERLMTTLLIQPHVTNKITPERLLPLPWDTKKEPAEAMPTKEAARARWEAIKAREAHKYN